MVNLCFSGKISKIVLWKMEVLQKKIKYISWDLYNKLVVEDALESKCNEDKIKPIRCVNYMFGHYRHPRYRPLWVFSNWAIPLLLIELGLRFPNSCLPFENF